MPVVRTKAVTGVGLATTQTPLQNPSAPAGAFGEGIGQALGQVARDSRRTAIRASEQERRDLKIEEREAANRSAKASLSDFRLGRLNILSDGEDAYLRKEGRDAVEAQQATLQKLKDLQLEIGEKLGPGDAQDIYNEVSPGYYDTAAEQMSYHARNQMNVWNDREDATAVELNIAEAASSWKDNSQQLDNISRGLEFTAQRNDWSEDTLDLAVLNAQTDAHARAIGNILVQEPQKAMAYLEAAKEAGEITDDAYNQNKLGIEAATDPAEAIELAAMQVYDQTIDGIADNEINQTSTIDEMYEQGLLGEGVSAVKKQISLKNSIRSAAAKQIQIGSIDDAMKNNWRLPKSADSKASADEWLKQNAVGEDGRIDPEVLISKGAELAHTLGWVPPIIDNTMSGSVRSAETLPAGAVAYKALYGDKDYKPKSSLSDQELTLLASTAEFMDTMNAEAAAKLAWNASNPDEAEQNRRKARWEEISEDWIKESHKQLESAYGDGANDDFPVGMTADHDRVFKMAFDSTGSDKVASEVAINHTRKVWSKTNINGKTEYQLGGFEGGELIRDDFDAEAIGTTAIVISPDFQSSEEITIDPKKVTLKPPPFAEAQTDEQGRKIFNLYDKDGRILMGMNVNEETGESGLGPLQYVVEEIQEVKQQQEKQLMQPMDEAIEDVEKDILSLQKDIFLTRPGASRSIRNQDITIDFGIFSGVVGPGAGAKTYRSESSREKLELAALGKQLERMIEQREESRTEFREAFDAANNL